MPKFWLSQFLKILMKNWRNLFFKYSIFKGVILVTTYRSLANRTLAFYQNLGFFDRALWSCLAKNCQNMKVFSDSSLPKLTKVRPKRVSWRSNQEWHSICVDTVMNFTIVNLLIKVKKIFLMYQRINGSILMMDGGTSQVVIS